VAQGCAAIRQDLALVHRDRFPLTVAREVHGAYWIVDALWRVKEPY
jgi:hypothetical protein